MTCYMSYEKDQSVVYSGSSDYEFDYDGEVVCSVFGTFFSIGGKYTCLFTPRMEFGPGLHRLAAIL